jgi:hypothetical protein
MGPPPFLPKAQQYEVDGAMLASVGSMYCGAIKQGDNQVPDERCALIDASTWWSDGVTDQQQADWKAKIFKETAVEGASSSVTTTKSASITANFPGIGAILAASGSFSYGNNSTATYSADRVFRRTIQWLPLSDAVHAGALRSSVVPLFTSRDYLIVSTGIVLQGYKASITFDKTLSADAKANLTAALTSLAANTGGEFKFSDENKGQAQFTAKEVVVRNALSAQPADITMSLTLTGTLVPVKADVLRQLVANSLIKRP